MRSRTFSVLVLLGLATMVGCSSSADLKTSRDDGAAAAPANASAKCETIHNDFNWVDQNGARILTRSGCLCQFDGVFYWYGGNPRGFREQYCYTSTDLVHWTNRGVVLSHDTDANRIDVLYNDKTKQYVMFLKYDGNGAHFAIATADRPEGPFTIKSKSLIDDALIGDMAMFQDDDGTAYLCYVSWKVGTNAQHGIYRMSADYLTPEKQVYLWNTGGREAPHMFKRNGIYYYGTSKTAWIDSTGTSYYTAKQLEGPWSPAAPLPTPGSTNSWDTQVDFVFPIRGARETLYMYAGDRWVKDTVHGRTGEYAWLPLEFDGDTPTLNYYQDWDVDPAAGTWRKFDPARNLASGKPVTASSEDSRNPAKNVAAPKTYRDYVSSHWDSEASDPQWIRVDLGSATEFNRVILKWNAAAAKEFKIQTSQDGEHWTDVYSTSHGSGLSVTDERFPTTTARYVRMYGTQRAPVVVSRTRGIPTTRSSTRPATRPATTQAATAPAKPTVYSLFDFMVLKD